VGKVKASDERLATGKPMTIRTMRLGIAVQLRNVCGGGSQAWDSGHSSPLKR